MNENEVIKRFKKLGDPKAAESMARFGISPGKKIFGVKIPDLRKLAKEIGKDHTLAKKLWAHGARETMILASMIGDPEKVTERQMEKWVNDFYDWETCDQCVSNLFAYAEPAWRKAVEWSAREKEFVKRAGFVMMARLAVSDKTAKDAAFEYFFPIIKREAGDGRNFVKKGVNWALRQIGKRNVKLNKKAITVAKDILKINNKSAKWTASDALRELQSKAVQGRLRMKR